MEIEFTGEVIHWRGPAPFFFIPTPDKESSDIKLIANRITYGWGVIPATVTIGDTTIKTALFPKDGKYLVPLKKDFREKELLELGDKVKVKLEFEINL